jgi:hypothetical protein
MCDLIFVDDELESEPAPSLNDLNYEQLVEKFPYYPERNSWKMRVDIHQPEFGNVTVEQCLNVLKDSETYMYSVEKIDSDNPHFQALVNTSVRKDTIVARIKKLGVSKSGFAFTKCKEQWPIEYIAYLLKEGNPHYHDSFPISVRLAGVKRQEYVHRQYLDKKAEKKRNPVWRKIVATIPSDFDYQREGVEHNIMRYVVQYHIDNERDLFRGRLVSYMDTILNNMDPHYTGRYISNLLKFQI